MRETTCEWSESRIGSVALRVIGLGRAGLFRAALTRRGRGGRPERQRRKVTSVTGKRRRDGRSSVSSGSRSVESALRRNGTTPLPSGSSLTGATWGRHLGGLTPLATVAACSHPKSGEQGPRASREGTTRAPRVANGRAAFHVCGSLLSGGGSGTGARATRRKAVFGPAQRWGASGCERRIFRSSSGSGTGAE